MADRPKKKAPAAKIVTEAPKQKSLKALRKDRIRLEQAEARERNERLRRDGEMTPYERARYKRKMLRAADPEVQRRRKELEAQRERDLKAAADKLARKEASRKRAERILTKSVVPTDKEAVRLLKAQVSRAAQEK